jgi:hypothetical protein
MLRARVVHAVVGAMALLAIGGCGTDGDEKRATESPEVAWAGSVCESVADRVSGVTRIPRFDPSDPAKTKENVVGYLRTLSDALGSVRESLKGLGAPSVTDGKAVFDKTVARLGKSAKSIEGVATKLEKTAVQDEQTLREAMAGVWSGMATAGSAKGPIKDLRANAELNKAFAMATACRELRA